MTIFYIYLRTELNYLSKDIILCGFVVVIYTLYGWTSQILFSNDAQLRKRLTSLLKKSRDKNDQVGGRGLTKFFWMLSVFIMIFLNL